METGYRYILRYYIDPGFNEDERIRELVRFCQDSRIMEVMFFYNPEELFQGYPPAEEIDRWFALAKKVKAALTEAGIDMSLNPWTTTVHLSRGRHFGPDQQGIQPLVGETGAVSTITACPFDKIWQKQLADLFCRMAVEIDPVTIWIEDDWRLHNHEPEMKYGGCFCPLHLQRFEEKTGIHTDRETLLKNVTAAGTPHPWRKPWLEVCGESLREPAEYLQKRIHEVNPKVRLGLMCSLPDIHSIEGRNWQLFKTAFSPDGPLPLRPHLPPYTEGNALHACPSSTRQTVSELPAAQVEIYPELENSPRSGAYSKSCRFSAWEIGASVVYGSQGITINHYDMMGNGIALDPEFGKMLAAIRPRLDVLTGLGLSEENAVGVDVLYSPEVAAAIHSRQEGTLHGLRKDTVIWSDILGILGISHRLTRAFDVSRLTAVSGDTLRTFSDDELRKMLSGQLLLDADSVQILQERGFGKEIGLASCRKGGDDGHAYESVEDGDEAYYGVGFPRMCAQRDGHYLIMEPLPGAEILSSIRKYDRSVLYPGMIRFRNSLGGTVLSCAHFPGQNQFFMAFFNIFRRKFMQRLAAACGTPVLLGQNDPLNVYCNHPDCGWLLTVTNPSSDPLEQVKLSAPGLEFSSVQILDPQGKWQGADWNRLPGLDPLGVMYILLK